MFSWHLPQAHQQGQAWPGERVPQWQHMADNSLMTRCCQSAPCSLRRRRRSGKVHAPDRHDNVSAVLATEKQSLADLRLAWMLPLALRSALLLWRTAWASCVASLSSERRILYHSLLLGTTASVGGISAKKRSAVAVHNVGKGCRVQLRADDERRPKERTVSRSAPRASSSTASTSRSHCGASFPREAGQLCGNGAERWPD